ncbi:MAG: hypothetical protein LBG70_02935, partial [Bifidobacteriaceae bacterium]|nr:hypothetical protein [Bifidobacteriaceae bacterium]
MLEVSDRRWRLAGLIFCAGLLAGAAPQPTAWHSVASTTGQQHLAGELRVGERLRVVRQVELAEGESVGETVWQANGRLVATGESLLVPAELVGMHVQAVTVIEHADGQVSRLVAQGDYRVVAGAPLRPQRWPSFDRVVPRLGQPVRVSTGVWQPQGGQVSYQWMRDDRAIAGATSAQYTPVLADLFRHLSVKVS